jgi:hypothetical protein
MPIEIKELHIKINVKEGGGKSSDADGDGKNKLVQECLDQVMTILKNKDER